MTTAIQQKQAIGNETGRYNIYVAVHKGLRGFMVDTLTQLGKVDVTDDCEFAAVITQVRSLLDTCRSHVQHENDFLHPVLERAVARSSQRTSYDHEEHLRELDGLVRQLEQLSTTPESGRSFLTRSLYLRMTRFVAENFEHMAIEETANHQILIGAHSDEELLQIEGAIVASMPPEKNLLFLRWMLSCMNTAERVFTLTGMKQGMPPEVFQGVIALARDVLSQRDFFKLEKSLAEV